MASTLTEWTKNRITNLTNNSICQVHLSVYSKMKRNNYTVVDHLGNDFDNQRLIERKRRIDAQIDEYTRIYALPNLNSKEESLIYDTINYLLEIQRNYSTD